MKAYHLDILNRISPETKIIEPFTDYSKFTQVPMTAKFCNEKFPNGLSEFGFKFTKSCLISSLDLLEYVKEMILEYIRQMEFPDKVSRLQCMFGVKNPCDIKKWYNILIKYYEFCGQLKPNTCSPSVFVLEVEDNSCLEVDAYWRDKREMIPCNPPNSEYFSIAHEYYISYNYWSGQKAPSELHSRPELLIPLPAKVVDKLGYLEFVQKYCIK